MSTKLWTVHININDDTKRSAVDLIKLYLCDMQKNNFIDLACHTGGFYFAIEDAADLLGMDAECVFAGDIDKDA